MPGKRRQWRKELKKQQRKRKRRSAAIIRDQLLEEEEAKKLKDPVYQEFLQQQALLEEQKLREIERIHDAEEEAWLRRDLLAHRQFRLQQQQRAEADAAANAIREQQEKELLVKLAEEQRQRDEREKRKAAAAAEFEQMMQSMETFLNNDDGEPPAELCRLVESRPGQQLCSLYERTNCCRFGPTCIKNHRRPLLSNIIVVRHFFMHPLLEEEKEHQEYANADSNLELSEQDLCEAYNEFFEDVLPEFEGFGYIQNFRAVRNTLRYLRGHVFVEYIEERSALRAFIKLQGRYYAGKQLNVEFANRTTWHNAICGLSHSRKCLKGNKCHYLHLFQNPGNKYNTPIGINRTPGVKAYMATPLLSWNAVTASDVKQSSRNWRWSESPEVEVPAAKVELEPNKKETSNMLNQNSRTEFKALENAEAAQSVAKSYTDVSKKHKRKKHKHERDKAHKKHKRKHAHSSDSIDSDAERRDKCKASESKKSSSSKHRRTSVRDHDKAATKDESKKRKRSLEEEKRSES